MSLNNIGLYFQQTVNYYLKPVWPKIRASIYHDNHINGSIFELKLENNEYVITSRKVVDLAAITMCEFDITLKRFYCDFYHQVRTSIVLKSMGDNNLKYLTPGVEYDILPQVEKGN